jgi:L-threonine kinase
VTVVAETVGYVPATCGELLQGVGDDGPVLVSLPIAVMGTARVTLTEEPGLSLTPELPHARAALELALGRIGWEGGATVRLGGEIPHARGMGSSTADVAGIIGAVHRAGRVALGNEELVRLMTQVDPSDTSPLGGLWAIDHVEGRHACQLAPMPSAWWVAVVDSGVPVRTADVHRTCGGGPSISADTVRRTRWTDPEDVARVATESALRNQDRLPHAAFEAALRVSRRVGALGICVAHSGSLCSVICRGRARAVDARHVLAAEGLHADIYPACAPGLRVRAVASRVP